jgi:hypothetical protein
VKVADVNGILERLLLFLESGHDLRLHPSLTLNSLSCLLHLQVADVNGIVERLLLFLESGYDHIVAETLVQLKDLLRRYPDLGEVSKHVLTINM